MNSPARRWIVLLMGVHLLLLTPKAFSQFGPYLTLKSTLVTNVSGICYSTYTFTSSSPFCLFVTNTPVVRSDTNFYTSFTVGAISGCIVSTDPGFPPPTVTDTVVLGALEPGEYQLTYNVSYGGPLENWTTLLTVPSPATNAKMLTLCQTNGGLSLCVDGVPDVRYVIQSSCDFTNWTNIQTNTGAPFTATIPAPTNACSYYRVQVQQTP